MAARIGHAEIAKPWPLSSILWLSKICWVWKSSLHSSHLYFRIPKCYEKSHCFFSWSHTDKIDISISRMPNEMGFKMFCTTTGFSFSTFSAEAFFLAVKSIFKSLIFKISLSCCSDFEFNWRFFFYLIFGILFFVFVVFRFIPTGMLSIKLFFDILKFFKISQ